jgi:hypothetical protein
MTSPDLAAAIWQREPEQSLDFQFSEPCRSPIGTLKPNLDGLGLNPVLGPSPYVGPAPSTVCSSSHFLFRKSLRNDCATCQCRFR